MKKLTGLMAAGMTIACLTVSVYATEATEPAQDTTTTSAETATSAPPETTRATELLLLLRTT